MKNRLASILVLTGCMVLGCAQGSFAACGEKSQSAGDCNSNMVRSVNCDMADCGFRPAPDECESAISS